MTTQSAAVLALLFAGASALQMRMAPRLRPCGAPPRHAAPVCQEGGGGALAQLGDQFEAALGSLPDRYAAGSLAVS